jgi:hypothetical protein
VRVGVRMRMRMRIRCDYRIIGGLVEAGDCVVCQAGTNGAARKSDSREQGAGVGRREYTVEIEI